MTPRRVVGVTSGKSSAAGLRVLPILLLYRGRLILVFTKWLATSERCRASIEA